MKKFIASSALFLLMATSLEAAELKVGVVSMQRLLTQAPQIEVINAKMQKQFTAPKEALQKEAADIKELEKEIKRNELMMSEGKLEDAKRDYVQRIQKFREKEAGLSRELKTVQNQELGAFQAVIGNVLKKLAEKEKFDLILADGVLYAAPKLDITDKVLDALKSEQK